MPNDAHRTRFEEETSDTPPRAGYVTSEERRVHLSKERNQEWKLENVDHSPRTKGQPTGLRVAFELTLYSKHLIRHAWPVQASRSSRVPAPPGIHIHSVRR